MKSTKPKKALVCGAGGFIGSHLVRKLKEEGYEVYGVDIKYPEFSSSKADQFVIADLRNGKVSRKIFNSRFDEVYQLAADMGGAGYLFTGEFDADVMRNSALINLNVLHESYKSNVRRIFFSSSACIYPKYNQTDPNNPRCHEDSAYPALPDSEYGWEKLFSERLYLSYMRNRQIEVRIARFHNVFGPEGPWRGGREKSPAAICRKIAEAEDNGRIEIWGDGRQTRSFLYIDECIEGIRRFMKNDTFTGPVNIGSEEMISINEMVDMIMKIAGKKLGKIYVDGPVGVRGRNSDNRLIREKLGWAPTMKLEEGLYKTYHWIKSQIEKTR